MLNLALPKNVNYCATVVELKHFVPLAGCDNVQAAFVFGNQVIVGKDAKPGDIGLYFPVEVALSDGFLRANNLYRKPEWGNVDPTKKGFFEEHGRVKCVKFRGHKSEGFYIPLTSLQYLELDLNTEYLATDIKYFPVGSEFDEVKGHEICRKYVPARNPGRAMSAPRARQGRVEDRIVSKQFNYHIDTAKLDRNIHKLNPTDLISITDKWHGCLSYNTRVLLPDFNWKTIGSLVNDGAVGTEVLGYKDGQIISTKIINVFNNGKSPVWLKISGRRVGGGWGGNRFSVYATPNHKFWVNGEYVAAHTLALGDRVSVFRNSPELTSLQQSVLLGKILGDATICSFDHTKTAEVQYSHMAAQREYVEWTQNALGYLSREKVHAKKSGYGSEMLSATTSRLPVIYDFCKDYLVSGKKFISEKVVEALDPVALAFWYMDDGTRTHSAGQEDRAVFATNSFSREECVTLCRGLAKFGLKASLENHGAGWRIRLLSDSSDKFFMMIAPFVVGSMRYKLPERYQNGTPWLPQDRKLQYKTWIVEQEIDSVEMVNAPQGCDSKDRFDIETGTHNFFANGVLVHNSSAIFAHVLTNRPLMWYERCLAALGIRIEKTCYDFVWASRRVIKGVGEKPRSGVQHYYKSDVWGTVFEEVKDLIPKGYTLYGEIVGYTPDGAAIQSGYHYGCVAKQHKFLVYRVTYTNPDGKVLNLSWPQIKEFCAARGLEPVLELYYGVADKAPLDCTTYWHSQPGVNTTRQEEWQTGFLAALKSAYVKDQMCQFNMCEVPAEGVVLRIDRGTEFEAYKCKNTRFLEFETKQLDKGTIDMETQESVELEGAE